MTTITRTWDQLNVIVAYQLTLLGSRTRDRRGAVSTEMAIVVGLLAAAAIIIIAIIASKGEDAANNIQVS
ncbi:MAG: hypothetical protein HKN26_11590 [Acidimicrobiales bacterium]|nr:hypothetical protein [Acidimicrobiales bacterium]